MLLLTWHGTIVCLREGGGGLVHLPLPVAEPSAVPLEVDTGQAPLGGEKQMHPALGFIAVHGGPQGVGVSLTRYGRFLSAAPDSSQVAFDQPEAGERETLLPLSKQDCDVLVSLLGRRWILAESRRVLKRSEIRLLPGFTLQVGAERVALARSLPLAAPAPDGRLTLGAGNDAVLLAQAQPAGSALLSTGRWPVRARRAAEAMALGVHRALTGHEPEQAVFEEAAQFLLDHEGPAGLVELIETRRLAQPAPPPEAGEVPPGTAAWPAIGQPVVSLGASCVVAYTLRRIGLDQPPMPFDWLSTTPAMVRHCVETDFAVLLDRAQYRSLAGQAGPGEPEDGCAHAYYECEYGIGRVFNHNDPTREADYRYTEACVDRFRDLLASGEPKLFVQVAEVAGSSASDFRALADLLDRRTSRAMLVQLAVQPPDPGLAVPLLSVAARHGRHVLYELQPLSRLTGEGFAHAADGEVLARTVAAHAASPEATAAPPVASLRDVAAEDERSRALHSVLLGWAMREMAPWHRAPVDGAASLRRFEALNAKTNWAFIYRFANGAVSMDGKPDMAGTRQSHQDRAFRYLQFFESVVPMLPGGFEVTICVGVGDKVPLAEVMPIFCFQKQTGAPSLLLPDVDFLLNEFYEGSHFADTGFYAAKTRQAVFAGGTTGGMITPEVARKLSIPRLRAAAYFTGNPDVDFRLPKIVQCTVPEAEDILRAQPFCRKDVLPWSEQLKRRFLISIDGNGATCSRVAISLLSDSVLLKYDSRDVLYYFGGLQPWVHYAPVAEDADVAWIMAQEARDPAAFARIAANGREFARTYLTRASAQLYTALLLRLYAENASDRPVGALRPPPAKPAVSVKRAEAGTHVVAHVQQRGDMPTRADGWTGLPDSTLAIEGFAVFLGSEFAHAALTYRVVMSDGALSEVGRAGDYRGTRGENRPILGFWVASDETAPVVLDVSYEARFINGVTMGPLDGGELCQAEHDAPLEAFRLTLKRRAAATPAETG